MKANMTICAQSLGVTLPEMEKPEEEDREGKGPGHRKPRIHPFCKYVFRLSRKKSTTLPYAYHYVDYYTSAMIAKL